MRIYYIDCDEYPGPFRLGSDPLLRCLRRFVDSIWDGPYSADSLVEQ